MLTPEELRNQAWTWSFSKFKSFQECGEKHRLHYLEGMRLPALSQRPFFQGSVAHKTVEKAHELIVRGEASDFSKAFTILDEVFDSHAENIDWRDEQERMLARGEATDLMNSYVQLLQEFGLDSPVVKCEYWIGTHESPLIRPSGVRLVGAIDWLYVDEVARTARIYDGKSSKGTKYLDKRQLILYAMAVEQIFDVRVEELGYLMMRWGKPILYRVDGDERAALEKEMASFEAELVAASQMVEAGGTGALPGMSLCSSCQYSTVCGPFRNWIIDGGTSEEVEW